MRPDKLAVAILILGLVIIVGSLIIADMNSNYDLNMGEDDPNFNLTLQRANSTIQNTTILMAQIQNESLGAEVTTLDTVENVFRGGFGAVRLMGNSFSLLNSMIVTIATALSIPPIITSVLLTIIFVLAIFSIIYIFVRFVPGT